MLRKLELYRQAVALRGQGLSYNEILAHVPVSRGTMSRWCSSIVLTSDQEARIAEKHLDTPLIKGLLERAAQDGINAKQWADQEVRRIKGYMHDGKALLAFTGSLLYWAEGTKFGSKHKNVEFTNTDPRMIEIMMRFFREVLNVPDAKTKIVVRIGAKGDVESAKQHWLQITRLPPESLRTPELLTLTEKSKSLQKYPYGMCRIVVYDVSVARKIDAFIKECITFIGIVEPPSLNGLKASPS